MRCSPGPRARARARARSADGTSRHFPVVLAPHTSQSGWDQVDPWASQDTVWACHLGQVVKPPTEKASLEVQVLLRLLDT